LAKFSLISPATSSSTTAPAIGGTAKAGQDFLHWTVGGEASWAPYGWAKDDPAGWFDNVLGFHAVAPFLSVAHGGSSRSPKYSCARPT
jgi:hypothetical protein